MVIVPSVIAYLLLYMKNFTHLLQIFYIRVTPMEEAAADSKTS
jgi:hypothetical protein